MEINELTYMLLFVFVRWSTCIIAGVRIDFSPRPSNKSNLEYVVAYSADTVKLMLKLRRE